MAAQRESRRAPLYEQVAQRERATADAQRGLAEDAGRVTTAAGAPLEADGNWRHAETGRRATDRELAALSQLEWLLLRGKAHASATQSELTLVVLFPGRAGDRRVAAVDGRRPRPGEPLKARKWTPASGRPEPRPSSARP